MSKFADQQSVLYEHDKPQDNLDNFVQSCEPIERFLEFKNDNQQQGDTTSVSMFAVEDSEKDDEENRYNVSSFDKYFVPLTLIERWGSAMGILICLSLPSSRFSLISIKKFLTLLRYCLP